MRDSNIKSHAAKKQPKRFIFIAVVLILLAAAIAYITYSYTHSNAKEAASPIEQRLLASGAIKVCGGGSAGRGPDDYVSGYTAYYETSLSRERVVELITQASTAEGYHVEQAQSGSLPIPDNYIDKYYFDHSSKIISLPGAETGPAKLTFAIGNAFDEKTDTPYEIINPPCNKKTLKVNNDASHVSIKMQLELPRNNP